MKLPFLSHSKSLDPKLSSSPPWPWPVCAHIKTLSFRASDPKDNAFLTFNSAFLDTEIIPPDSFFTFSSSSRSESTVISEDPVDPVETVIRGLRSDRLFFDPEQSSSLLSMADGRDDKGCLAMEDREIEPQEDDDDDDDGKEKVAYKESEILSMESNFPYEDFRRSMEEMVEAHGLKDWQGLEELLGCYLKINGHQNHGFIVGAFIDLLVSLSFASSSSTSTSSSSSSTATSSSSLSSSLSSPSSLPSLPPSFLTTPRLSPILDHGDDDGSHSDDDNDGNSKLDKQVDDLVSS